ncbi:Abi family protein [Nitrosococcus oceani]|uniref:Abi family protein n=1 Tax=Nitrosococcus oceani TaxID=1229 RepID=UPI0004E8C3A7|nr:Abi family protein [Nitrosococcus oceani]KFI21390.1 ABC transporter permease [Nitrosococcus oceani]
MPETYQKPALTFDDQLALMRERGLVINNSAYALSQLSAISYYRLSAYWHPFRVRDGQGNISSEFIEGTRFEDVVALYEFDRELRLLVMAAIERIEVHLRTLITYHIGHTYGAFGHADPGNFHTGFRHKEWLAKLEKEAQRSNDAFITHYKNKYTEFPTLPIWMTTEIMTLGSLSLCYRGLNHKDKKVISDQLGIHHKRLGDWLHTLTYIRNVCAHHSRLWNRELSIRPEKSKAPEWNPPITPRNDRIFYILLMLKFLLKTINNTHSWTRQCNELIVPIALNARWCAAMGMPDNWKQHPVWGDQFDKQDEAP